MPYDGGVFIAVAPDIIYAKDHKWRRRGGRQEGDVQRVRHRQCSGAFERLALGASTAGFTGSRAATAARFATIRDPGAKPVSVRGRDFRFRPDGSAFEAISGGGQFGHSFDDWGHRFTCNNSNHIRQIVLPSHYLERNPALIPPAVLIDIAAEGPAAPVFRVSQAEPWRVVRTPPARGRSRPARRLPPTELFATGFFTSATGVTIYRGSAYPPEYRGNVCSWGTWAETWFIASDSRPRERHFSRRVPIENVEFLASTDNWFRPVNFANTPEGTLLMLDMYRETIEHPFSIPEPIKKHLDLTSGNDRGRLYNLVYAAARGGRGQA